LIWLVTYAASGQAGVILAVLAILAGSAVNATVSLMLVRRMGQPARPVFDTGRMLPILARSLPLALTLVFNLVYFRIDNFILTIARPTSEVGLYGFAYKVFEFPLMLPTFFMNALYPLFVKYLGTGGGESDLSAFVRLARRALMILAGSAVVIAIIMWIAAPMVAWVRPEFADSSPALRILSLGLPLFFISSLTMWMLIAQRRQLTLALIYGTTMVFNISANVVLIPRYGYMAAAWMTVVTEFLVLLLGAAALVQYFNKLKRLQL
jgi:O-antigen/teichoic acid export membrane protein